MRKRTFIILVLTLAICASILLAPVFPESTNPCGSCHPGYYQYLDLLEGDSGNSLPTTLTVDQTKTVTVTLENKVNTVQYAALSSVSVTLSSKNGHFTVATPIYNVGTLQKGTATATWQITGVSEGSDELVITASGRNSHLMISFSDSYSPNPAITVQSSQQPPETNFTVTIQSSPNGTTTPASGTHSYPSGTSVTFAATPNSGNKFDQWLVNGTPNTANPMTLTVESNLTIIPVFSKAEQPPPDSFTVTVNPSVNGTTTPPSGIYYYNNGDTLTITATPNTNHKFDHWLINGIKNNNNPITLEITGNSTIEPIFSETTGTTVNPTNLTITLSSPTSGEKWQAETIQRIEWTTSGSTGTLNITIEYSDSANSGTWKTIAVNLPNNGSISWIVPNNLTTCYIRANATDNETTLNATALTEVEITPNDPLFPLLLAFIITVPLLCTLIVFLKWKTSRTKSKNRCPPKNSRSVA